MTSAYLQPSDSINAFASLRNVEIACEGKPIHEVYAVQLFKLSILNPAKKTL